MAEKPFPFSVCKECCSPSSGGGGESIIIDTEMSDTSENAVQNKVVKSYVDEKIGDIDAVLEELHNYAQALIGGAE